jgi:hypothetical protein
MSYYLQTDIEGTTYLYVKICISSNVLVPCTMLQNITKSIFSRMTFLQGSSSR